MDTANRTKTHLSNSLKRLSKEIPLCKISVKDLCQYSNVNRGTFYYHFKDIFDLISWTYHTQITLPSRRIIAGYSITEMPSITSFILTQLYNEKEFYTQALTMEGQNNLAATVEADSIENWKLLWKKALGVEKFEDIKYENIDFLLDYFVRGHLYATHHWIETGMKTSPEKLGKILDDASMKGAISFWQEILLIQKSN